MADFTTLWSNTTDFSAAVADFPGITLKSLWLSEADSTKFHGTNGTYLQSDNTDSTTYTFSTSKVTITTTGVLVGMCVYIEDTDAAHDDGVYEITAVDGSDITINTTSISGNETLVQDDVVSFYIGGISDAFDGSTTLQAELDLIGINAGAVAGTTVNNLDILCHGTIASTLTATIDIDGISGSTASKVLFTGVSSTFIDDGTLLLIETNTALVNGLFQLAAAGLHIVYKNIDYDAGANTNDATYCVNGAAATDGRYSSFINCRFHGAISHGLNARTFNLFVTGCEMDNNGGNGYHSISTSQGLAMVGCYLHDNTADGAEYRGSLGCFMNNIFDSNGGHGYTEPAEVQTSTFVGNVFYGHATASKSGMNLSSASIRCNYVNNTFSDNALWGIDFNGSIPQTFTRNHAFSNTSGPADIATTDAAWLILFDGDNIVSDPLFTDAAGGNFIPTSSSPLIDAGIGGTGDTIGALCATAGGGAVNLMTGLLT